MGQPAEVLDLGEEDPYDDTWDVEDSDTWYPKNAWSPEGEIREDPIFLEKVLRKIPKNVVQLKPSEFTERAFRMPKEDGTGFGPFSFEGRAHLRQIYDTPARRILLCCARQVEKSTMVGNRALCYMSLVTAMRILLVTPSATQTKTFSNDRIKEPIETSPLLKKFTTKMLSQNILEKQFVNRSKLTMRYAFLNADRTRGIPAWQLDIDEVQDVLKDNIPVIEQCTSHAPDKWKSFVYSGTPKSLDNVIEDYRANGSTQGEWVVPCEGCGNWNILGEKNIGLKGPICARCGKGIDPQGPKAQWAWMVEPDEERIKVPWESYRIPQLMVPWKIRNWNEVLHDYQNYSRPQFFNECLGVSYESGLRPLTSAQIRECCTGSSLADFPSLRPRTMGQPFFAGIDWGTGDGAYTVLTIGTYYDMKFRMVYIHRFAGEEADPEIQIDKIIDTCEEYNIRLVGSDWGFGFGMNSRLQRKFGARRVQLFQYVATLKGKMMPDKRLGRWKVHRTHVMAAIFDAIKKHKAEFPPWEEFAKPYAQDFTNIYAEYNEKLRMVQYDHKRGNPDDSFHAFLLSWLVSMLIIPRPDILSPDMEDETGRSVSDYQGPRDQG